MENWPEDGLKDVAHQMLDLPGLQQKDEIVRQAIKMHRTAHRAIEEHAKEADHHLHLTPCSFKNLMASFKSIYLFREKNLSE